MADHRPPPQPGCVETGIVRLVADRGGIEQHLGPHQHHRPRRLGIPLVPADPDADGRASGAPGLEAGVARPEVEFLLIAGAVGDVALAVDAGHRPVRRDHRQAVIMMRAVGLEEAGRDVDRELVGQPLHRQHRRMLVHRPGAGEQALILDAAEIMPLEQFGRQDHLRPARGRLADEIGDGGDVGVHLVGKRELEGGDGDRGHARHMGVPARPVIGTVICGAPAARCSGGCRRRSGRAPRGRR